MKNKSPKNIIIACFVALLLGYFLLPLPAKSVETLIDYPVVGGQDLEWETSLPGIIRYIYLFAIGICGAVALASILLGAIKYIGAAGNPSKMGDAKDQIFSAILGVVILLSSYLILNTINPDLVSLNINLNVDTATVGGRACYCADNTETSLWEIYSTPEECAEWCDEDCMWWTWDSGACRQN